MPQRNAAGGSHLPSVFRRRRHELLNPLAGFRFTPTSISVGVRSSHAGTVELRVGVPCLPDLVLDVTPHFIDTLETFVINPLRVANC